jgi:hypothetical protein
VGDELRGGGDEVDGAEVEVERPDAVGACGECDGLLGEMEFLRA